MDAVLISNNACQWLFFIWLLQSEMGLATEQLSQQLLEYEKKVSIDAIQFIVSKNKKFCGTKRLN